MPGEAPYFVPGIVQWVPRFKIAPRQAETCARHYKTLLSAVRGIGPLVRRDMPSWAPSTRECSHKGAVPPNCAILFVLITWYVVSCGWVGGGGKPTPKHHGCMFLVCGVVKRCVYAGGGVSHAWISLGSPHPPPPPLPSASHRACARDYDI